MSELSRKIIEHTWTVIVCAVIASFMTGYECRAYVEAQNWEKAWMGAYQMGRQSVTDTYWASHQRNMPLGASGTP